MLWVHPQGQTLLLSKKHGHRHTQTGLDQSNRKDECRDNYIQSSEAQFKNKKNVCEPLGGTDKTTTWTEECDRDSGGSGRWGLGAGRQSTVNE